MSRRGWQMHTGDVSMHVCVLLILGLVFLPAGCQGMRRGLQRVQSVSTPTVTITTEAMTRFESVRGGFTLLLPPGWTLAEADHKELGTWHVEVPGRDNGVSLAALLDEHDDVGLEATAFYDEGALEASLMVAVLPRDDLSLQTYLRGMTEQTAHYHNAEVIEAALRYDLLASGLPAATILSTWPTDDTTTTAPSASYQVVLIDASGAQLIVLTFATAQTAFSALQPQFDAITRAIILSLPES